MLRSALILSLALSSLPAFAYDDGSASAVENNSQTTDPVSVGGGYQVIDDVFTGDVSHRIFVRLRVKPRYKPGPGQSMEDNGFYADHIFAVDATGGLDITNEGQVDGTFGIEVVPFEHFVHQHHGYNDQGASLHVEYLQVAPIQFTRDLVMGDKFSVRAEVFAFQAAVDGVVGAGEPNPRRTGSGIDSRPYLFAKLALKLLEGQFRMMHTKTFGDQKLLGGTLAEAELELGATFHPAESLYIRVTAKDALVPTFLTDVEAGGAFVSVRNDVFGRLSMIFARNYGNGQWDTPMFEWYLKAGLQTQFMGELGGADKKDLTQGFVVETGFGAAFYGI